ncbi:unnamed protein product, partial [Adineta ricciae]
GVYTFSNKDYPLLQIDKNYWYDTNRHNPDEFNYEYDGEQLKMKPNCEMIWMGTELGDAKDVTNAPESPYRTLLNIFKKAIKLRRQLAALRSDSLDFFYENYGDRVLAYSRRSN